MFNQRRDQHKRSPIGRLCLSMVMLLCFCVMMQMLGVPVTLLNPVASTDALGASVLEGFSVPPTSPQLAMSRESIPLSDIHLSVDVPVLDAALFRPPVP